MGRVPAYRGGMMLLVALTLLLSAPPAPAVAGEPAYVTAEVDRFTAEKAGEGIMLERFATRLVPASRTAAVPSDEKAIIAFLDRSQGCLRGWARLTVTFKDGKAGSHEARERRSGSTCDQPRAEDHLMRLFEAITAKRWPVVAEFVPGSLQFPIGIEGNGKLSRKTYDNALILAGKVPFPACDLLDDDLACDGPRTSGRTTCTCTGPRHTTEIDFQLDVMRMKDTPQLVSIRDKLTP